MRGAIPSRSCGARSDVITSRRPAVMISFIVWKNSSCVESLPAMNWTSSISSRSAFRSRCLNPIVSFSFSARMNSTMNFSADIDTTRAPRLLREEGVADRVQQVGLAAAGAAMDEQRVEADRRRRRERPRGGRRDLVGLADDEGLEPVARIEIGRVGIALGRRRRFLEDQQRRRARRIGGGDHADVADDRQDRLPGERQPLAEMRAHPVGHELARHDDVERAAVGLERAELGRLQPAVEGARAKIAAKSGADRFPGGFERRRNRRPGQLN